MQRYHNLITVLKETPAAERGRKFCEAVGLPIIGYVDDIAPRIGKSDFENPPGWVNVDALPPTDETKDYDYYKDLVPGFKDPYPINIIEHDGVMVVRDDMLPHNLGTKIRFASCLVEAVPEPFLFYAMPAHGQAGKVLSFAAKQRGKLLVAVSPLRSHLTTCHQELLEHGGVLLYYQTGGMAGARKRCRAIIHDQLDGQGCYVPVGVKHPLIVSGFVQTVRKICAAYQPDVIFSVASTMTMNHGIQLGALPGCEVHAIQVAGNSATKKWPGRAICHEHPQPFNEPCPKEDMPPFNSIPEYDAKGWAYARDYKLRHPEKKVMFWNVAGVHNIKDVGEDDAI